jgi:hypothetical protein
MNIAHAVVFPDQDDLPAPNVVHEQHEHKTLRSPLRHRSPINVAEDKDHPARAAAAAGTG